MRKVFCVITIALALSISGNLLAQIQNVPEVSPKPSRIAAVDINHSEIETLVRKMAAIRIVSVNDEYNLAIGVVSRLKTAPRKAPSAIQHSRITEIYHVISGSGTLVTGGVLKDLREIPANDETVTLLNGPSKEGSGIENGVSRKVAPGDVVIIPPNTPHWFREIPTEKIVYLVLRVDPGKVLPAGYTDK